jgi:glycosyltransferase involved in cell wall biosynthesis
MGENYWNGVTEDIYEGVSVHRIHLNWAKADDLNRILYDSRPVENWMDRFLNELKPDVVHVTSTVTLGVGILRSVRKAGIPLALTLTDFWFICPKIQLVHGDGSLCDGKKAAWECQSCLSMSSLLMQNLGRMLPEVRRRKIWERLAQYPWLAKKRGFRGILLNMVERKQVMQNALSIPDRIFAPSRFVQQVFIENTSVYVDVLHHGHDLSWLNHFNGKTLSKNIRIGYIGQIDAIKGLHILIEAFQLANQSKHLSLDIWGDLSKNPGYTQRLKALIQDESSIILRGRFERNQLATVLSDIDVLIVPSLWYENAPLVIQEAFAIKIPVIASNLGGMAEMVSNEVNGLLFERGNPVDLSQKLQRLVAEPDLLERLKTGIPKVRTTQEEVVELEMIYSDLVQKALTRKGMVKTAY